MPDTKNGGTGTGGDQPKPGATSLYTDPTTNEGAVQEPQTNLANDPSTPSEPEAVPDEDSAE